MDDGAAPQSVPKHWERGGLLTGAVLVLPVVLLIILDCFIRLRTPSLPPPPNPNGYRDLVRAGKMAKRLKNYEEASLEELRQFLEENAEALKVARLGLRRACRIPVIDQEGKTPVAVLGSFKKLRELFEIEGLLAEKEGRWGDAARSNSDQFRLGYQSAQGGCHIDFLIGSTPQVFAARALSHLLAKLSLEECRILIPDLEKSLFDQTLIDEIEATEKIFRVRHTGIIDRLWLGIESIFTESERPALQFNDLVNKTRAMTDLLLAQLALRAYQIEHGALPQSLSELVPGYLKELPLDPCSGQPLIYRPSPEGYKLYSVGPNGKDDLGLGDDMTAESR